MKNLDAATIEKESIRDEQDVEQEVELHKKSSSANTYTHPTTNNDKKHTHTHVSRHEKNIKLSRYKRGFVLTPQLRSGANIPFVPTWRKKNPSQHSLNSTVPPHRSILNVEFLFTYLKFVSLFFFDFFIVPTHIETLSVGRVGKLLWTFCLNCCAPGPLWPPWGGARRAAFWTTRGWGQKKSKKKNATTIGADEKKNCAHSPLAKLVDDCLSAPECHFIFLDLGVNSGNRRI